MKQGLAAKNAKDTKLEAKNSDLRALRAFVVKSKLKN